ncbi:hypothetical protein POTOM_060746 [Populus tomentosa]|uniref:NLP1-9 GAF domain-containing protein n=1 Tax=Populus tomentosa TaxID=118781 RepID=A0A8X7XT19_POPTO|nr:hypothetical protein POTOM_060746 [Populus tomentosa]
MISCGVGGIIAFPVLESDQPKYCCAVLELVTMEEKQDFDLETEKVSQALQAVDLRINLLPRLRPECFSRDQRAELTEIANVTRAVCLTHGFPLALTWIPCDYTWGAVDDISKSHCRLCNSGFLRTCELSIERTASYSDEEMQGFVNACEQLFLNTGQGAAGQSHRTYLPSFEPDVKEKHVNEYPRTHQVRKYNLNAAVAIVLRSTGAEAELVGERGSKVSKKNAPNVDDSDDKFWGFREWHKQKDDGDVVDSQKLDLNRYLGEPLENLDKLSDVLAWWRSKEWISGSFLVSLNVRSDSLVKQMFKYPVGPFTLGKPMSPEDLKLIQYVLNGRSEFFPRVLVCLAERF